MKGGSAPDRSSIVVVTFHATFMSLRVTQPSIVVTTCGCRSLHWYVTNKNRLIEMAGMYFKMAPVPWMNMRGVTTLATVRTASH